MEIAYRGAGEFLEVDLTSGHPVAYDDIRRALVTTQPERADQPGLIG